MQTVIDKWMDGQRGYLGPRTQVEAQRALVGEGRRLQLRNEPEPTPPSYHSTTSHQRWDWKWRENNPGPWAPTQADEAEEVEPEVALPWWQRRDEDPDDRSHGWADNTWQTRPSTSTSSRSMPYSSWDENVSSGWRQR